MTGPRPDRTGPDRNVPFCQYPGLASLYVLPTRMVRFSSRSLIVANLWFPFPTLTFSVTHFSWLLWLLLENRKNRLLNEVNKFSWCFRPFVDLASRYFEPKWDFYPKMVYLCTLISCCNLPRRSQQPMRGMRSHILKGKWKASLNANECGNIKQTWTIVNNMEGKNKTSNTKVKTRDDSSIESTKDQLI